LKLHYFENVSKGSINGASNVSISSIFTFAWQYLLTWVRVLDGPIQTEEGSQLAEANPQIDLPQRIDAPLSVNFIHI